jgi:hypothetical protein
MILSEVVFKRIVIQVIMRMPGVTAVADETAFVLHPAMLIKFVIVVKSLATEAAQWMALEASLVC